MVLGSQDNLRLQGVETMQTAFSQVICCPECPNGRSIMCKNCPVRNISARDDYQPYEDDECHDPDFLDDLEDNE